MDAKRLWRTIRLFTSRNRSAYIRKAHIFANFGEKSTMSSRKVPLYPELISIGNNVRLAANVSLVTHDMIHAMLNNRQGNSTPFREYMGCIRIDDNVFVGANTTILANVHIGSNVIIGACSLVNKDLESGYVYAGVPAKKICTLDEFVSKRQFYAVYPEDMKRRGDSIEDKHASLIWEYFWANRMSDNKEYKDV